MIKIFAAIAVCVVGFVEADPTRFLSQSAEIKPHAESFLEESEHERLAKKTAEAQKVFLQAMHKLQEDEERFEAEEKESKKKAQMYKAMASHTVVV